MTSATARRARVRQLPMPAGLRVATHQLSSVKILLPFAALVGVWWAIHAAGQFPARVLVSPARVWDTLVVLFSHGVLAEYISTSMSMIGIATAISLAIGVPIGFLVGSNRYAARGLEAFLRYLQGVSGIAWLPLVIIWFGFTHTTTLVVVIYTLVVPIIFNTMVGVRAVPEHYALARRQPDSVDHRCLSARCAAQHCGRLAAWHGLWLARADRSRNASSARRPWRSDFRRADLRSD
jgi:ABC-type proline/glycine betaine transport system permease subunit